MSSVTTVGLQQYLSSRVKIDVSTGCWLWRGAVTDRGYGKASWKQTHYRAHQLAALLYLNHVLGSGLSVCHHCDTPLCCNPDHLFIGTGKDNIQDAVRKRRHRNNRKTHCKFGHPFSSDNTYVVSGARKCVICKRRSQREYAQRKCAKRKKD